MACDPDCVDLINDVQSNVDAVVERVASLSALTPEDEANPLELQVADLIARVTALEEWRLNTVDPILGDHENRLVALENIINGAFENGGLVGFCFRLMEKITKKKLLSGSDYLYVFAPLDLTGNTQDLVTEITLAKAETAAATNTTIFKTPGTQA